MKSFSSTLLDSYDKKVSTITTCMKIVRLDGVTYRFTNLDEDIVVDGETYEATYHFSPTAYSSALGLQIENMEVVGAIDNIGINDLDILKNYFYGAEVWVFSVDYKNIAGGKNKVLYGTIGEMEVTDKEFKFELRGMSKRYVNLYSSYYGKICRARLGDSKCKVNLEPYRVHGSVYDTSTATISTAYLKLDFTAYSNNAPKVFEIQLIDLVDNNICTIDVENRKTGVTTITGTSTTCSGSDGNLYNLIDGNDSTYTCLALLSGNTVRPLTLAMDKKYDFSKIIIKDSYSTNYYINNMVLSTSTNGFTWTTLINIATLSYRSGDTITIPVGPLLEQNSLSERYKFRSLEAANFDKDYFQYGRITWTSGLNTGIMTEVISSGVEGNIELALPTPYNITQYDEFDIYPGCNHLLHGSDGSISTGHCKTKFNNVINFRGEPYLPNEDVLLSGYIAIREARETAEGEEPIFLEPVG